MHTRKGQKDWEGKSICQEMSPTMGCGELERERNSQEAANAQKGGCGGEGATTALKSSSNLLWAWEAALKSRVTFCTWYIF